MQNIEINIQLDPVEDGISWTPKKVKQEGKYALVIGTNGKYRLIDESEAVEILDRLSSNITSDYMGHTGFFVVCNKNKIIRTGDSRFIAGSVLIVKAGKSGTDLLTEEEVEKAKAEFACRLATLCADGMEFSAYEMD
mgnify:CR=1 FL=1